MDSNKSNQTDKIDKQESVDLQVEMARSYLDYEIGRAHV